MNLHGLLRNRAADGEPLRVGVIGAGKFGTMFLAQARLRREMERRLLRGSDEFADEAAQQGIRTPSNPA